MKVTYFDFTGGGWGNNNWISEFAAGSDGDTKVDLNFELGVVNE
jgi:hypothetical protein